MAGLAPCLVDPVYDHSYNKNDKDHDQCHDELVRSTNIVSDSRRRVRDGLTETSSESVCVGLRVKFVVCNA